MNQKKIKLGALVLMMFTTIFGFANGPVAFYQMGFASIIWYLVGALLFFLPTSMMYAEYGATYKNAKGGLYSWMEDGLGRRWAFIAAFIGLAAWVVWMVSTSAKVWISFSNFIFGADKTQTWNFLGLGSQPTIGLLAAAWMLVVSFLVTRGVKVVSRISSIGGLAVMSLNFVLLIASVVVLFAHGGQLAEPVHGLTTFLNNQNPNYQTPLQLVSFMIFAIFAYGGLEQSSGVTDSLDQPEKTFPRGAVIATIVIGLGYAISIILWGVTANFAAIHAMGDSANLGNITYVLMNNLGATFGNVIGLNASGSAMLGSWLARFAGLGMFLAYSGAFFVLVYAPIKSFILGTPKEVWPKALIKENKAGIPAAAVWAQALIVVLIVLGVNFGGKGASAVYLVLTNMANVGTVLPYVFLVLAFPFFKRIKGVDRPFLVFKNMTITWIVSIIVLVMLVGSIFFTILQPILDKDYMTAFWYVLGPVLFGSIAYFLYARAAKNNSGLNNKHIAAPMIKNNQAATAEKKTAKSSAAKTTTKKRTTKKN